MIEYHELFSLIEQKRISLTPEWEAGWHADVYEDQEIPIATGYGENIYLAVQEALSKLT